MAVAGCSSDKDKDPPGADGCPSGQHGVWHSPGCSRAPDRCIADNTPASDACAGTFCGCDGVEFTGYCAGVAERRFASVGECPRADAAVDTSTTDADAADGAPGDADASLCPVYRPSGMCAGTLNCTYGFETCCGMTHPSTLCSCDGGTWSCYSTDACYMPMCDAGADG